MKKKRKMSGTKKQKMDESNRDENLLILAKLEKEYEATQEELLHCQALKIYAKARMDETDRRLKEISPLVELVLKPFNAADTYKDK